MADVEGLPVFDVPPELVLGTARPCQAAPRWCVLALHKGKWAGSNTRGLHVCGTFGAEGTCDDVSADVSRSCGGVHCAPFQLATTAREYVWIAGSAIVVIAIPVLIEVGVC